MKTPPLGIHRIIWSLLLFGTLASAAVDGPAELAPGMQNPGYHEQPDWFKASFLDLREDVAEATARDKRLVLYFYQDGCPYCAKLLQENLGDQSIARLMQGSFDVVAINLWGDREVTGLSGELTTEKQLGSDLKVQFTPTMLLLDEAGQVVLRINGYFPPHRFKAALDYVAERREQVGESFADYAAGLESTEAKGTLHKQGGFLQAPFRLADNRDTSMRPLVVMFEQPTCRDCDELHEDILEREPLAYSLSGFDGAILDTYSRDPVQTVDGREIPIRDWAAELGIKYTPSLVFFDAAGREVFRTEGYFKAFHIHGALDYVATGAYLWEPSFQRYLAARREALAAFGIEVDLMD
ncbi:thioredoxin family protein [Thiocapsa marina]|uniref:Thioredoxin-related protein-like protein n=1 Tax=Thiocapsa marina 5811 TaxID=768671 RepID=F9U804_9GAMM|nr:thioredoxin fold domain-containing protein [Thiocapsa marina]EGV19784.1 thioredoxin-related protein-like protein [Thiocapsa marina 5811]